MAGKMPRPVGNALKTSDFDYPLPRDLIAQTPLEPRDQGRLMVLHRETGEIAHLTFSGLAGLLEPGDLLVFNDTRVIPARLVGRKVGTGGAVELLLLHRIEEGLWEVLARPGRRLQVGHVVELVGNGEALKTTAEVVGKGEGGTRVVRFASEQQLEELGQVPLPPYIHAPLQDPERYQTVYARVKGSVAAPTAGLHFTPTLLHHLQERGVRFTFLTLHVGLDSFRPVKEEDPREHLLHREYGELSAETALTLNRARAEGQRIVCVGTTTARLLEHVALQGQMGFQPFQGWVDLLILPGHRFRAIDLLLTNFHLPRSTLLMLVSAFAGRELVLRAYQEAVRLRYRFYSFGDGMLIL